MYQYINAVISGVAGLRSILSGYLENTKKPGIYEFFSVENKSYRSIVFSGLGLTVCLLLSMISIEVLLKSFPLSATWCVTVITGLAAVFIAGLLLKNEALSRKANNIENKHAALLAEKSVLEQKVSELLTHSDIARAAANSTTFGCFMGSIARLLRKDKTAREVTVFTNKNNCISAHTYYQLSDFSELCLSFTGIQVNDSEYGEDGLTQVNTEFFDARNLSLEYIDGNITIDGGLLYKGETVGRLRVTLFGCTEKSHSFKELLEGIVQNALSSVNISFAGVAKAMRYQTPELMRSIESLNTFMLHLAANDTVLGVVKLVFENNSQVSVERQKNILQTASAHISKALYNQNLYELAIKDGLTNIFNKRYLLDVLEKNISSAILAAEKLSFVLIDIDHFKMVNDTWGHQVGDMVLKRIAKIISDTARDSDIVARYGGEELAVLMPQTDVIGAKMLAERIRCNIWNEVFHASEGEAFKVTASFGVAELEQWMISPQELIEQSDKALYLAKGSGRNKVIISSELSVISGVA